MAVITLNPTKDTTMTPVGGVDATGMIMQMGMYYDSDNGTNNNYNPLIDFDWSLIPSGSNVIINSAYLKVYQEAISGGGWRYYIHRITGSWVETASSEPAVTTANEILTYFATGGNNTYSNEDVTQLVRDMKSSGGFGFRIKAEPAATDPYRRLTSREGVNKPQLVVTYTVNTAPNAPTLTGPAANVNTRTPTVTWTYSDPDSNPQGAYYVELVNGAYNAVLWTSGWISGTATSYTLPAGIITTDGTYYVRVKVQDSNGAVNQANGNGPDATFGNRSFISDINAPTATSVTGTQYLNVASGGTYRVNAFGLSDAIGVTNVRFAVWTQVNGQDDLVWYDGVNGGSGTWYKDVPIADHANAEGVYQCDVYGYDAAGNNRFLGTNLTTIDRTNPTIGSVDGTQYSNVGTGSQRVTAYNTADGVSGVQRTDFWYRKSTDGGTTWGAWTGPVTGTQSGANWYYDVPKSAGDGRYQVDIRTYDQAGNVSNGNTAITTYFYVDTVVPVAPTITLGTIKSTSVPISWTAFSDGTSSSGWSATYVYMRKFNGTSWVDIAGSPVTLGNVTSYTYTGLLENTQYHVIVQYKDLSGNMGSYQEILFTTNLLPTASIANLSSTGYVVNQRPVFNVSGTDGNGSNVELRIQISKAADFSTTLADTWATHAAEVGYAGWASKTVLVSGAINRYTPQVDLGTGTVYVRVQSYDVPAAENGPWSATYSFTINAPGWITTIKATDMSISKRAIDDLRTKVNAIRQARGLSVFAWTDPTIKDWNDPAGGTLIRDDHILDLRQALQDVATPLGVTLAWSNPSLTGINRNGQDWLDLRNKAVTL